MMLVISTTILFLGFYISTASTTPLVTNSSLLAPRTIPADNLCSAADQWLRRECDPQEGMTLWRDICYRDTSNVDYIYSNCPNYFLCSDFVDARGDNSIKCVPINRPGNTSPRTTDGDPQIGTSYKISADGSGRDTELAFSVTIANDMSASATAVFLSESYVKFFFGEIDANDVSKAMTVPSS